MAKHFSNDGLLGYNEKDKIKIPISQTGEMSTETRHIFLAILNNCEFKTMNDSIQGNRLANAIDAAEGKDEIVLEDGVHDWLKQKAEQVCPAVFRVNGSIIYEFIKEGWKKPQKSEAEAEGKEGKDVEAAAKPAESRPSEK